MSLPRFKSGSKPSGARALKHPYAPIAVIDGIYAVGVILPDLDNPRNAPWTVELFIVDPGMVRGWRVITLKQTFSDAADAKQHVKNNWDLFKRDVTLHQITDKAA